MLFTAKLRGEDRQIPAELETFSLPSILFPLPAALQAHLRNTWELNQGPLKAHQARGGTQAITPQTPWAACTPAALGAKGSRL